MARGFVYPALVLDWFIRRVLPWRLSIMTEAAHRQSGALSVRLAKGVHVN